MGIPSSADYLCTSSRDSFHCNGAKTWEASRVKPTEKCFYLARLSSLLKVRFFRDRDLALAFRISAKIQPEAHATLKLEKKRLWSGPSSSRARSFARSFFQPPSPDDPVLSPFPSVVSPSPFFSLSFKLSLREILRRGCRKREGGGGEGEGRNCVNYPLISASDPRITPRREC